MFIGSIANSFLPAPSGAHRWPSSLPGRPRAAQGVDFPRLGQDLRLRRPQIGMSIYYTILVGYPGLMEV